jgi:hypothetical protein
MISHSYFETFVYFIMPLIILVFGFFGNLVGIIVLQSKRLESMATRKMYCLLFFFDTIYLIHLVINYLELSYGIDITFVSSLSCKLHIYFNYSLANISPMILVYISIERLIEIKYPIKRILFKQTSTHIIYLAIIFVYNSLFYLPFPILIDQKITINEESHYVMCSFTDSDIDVILSWMDLINRVLVPFLLMIIFSILLIHSIFSSSNRILTNYTTSENMTFKKDIKLSITSLLLNLFYILLCLPISINDFVNFTEFYFTFTLYVFYMSYAVNFYIILISNSLVRREFLILFKIISATEQNYVVRYIQIDTDSINTRGNNNQELKYTNDKEHNEDEKEISDMENQIVN